MPSFSRSFQVVAVTVALALGAATVAPHAAAQPPTDVDRPTSTMAGATQALSAPWGTRTEHWLAAGLALVLGAATVAIGTGLSRYSIDTNARARDPLTLQRDAASLNATANDFMTAAEVMWAVGAGIAAIGLVWIIVLPFSTATPSPTAPSASLSLSPLGLSLVGSF
jgi:hypothetical protein